MKPFVISLYRRESLRDMFIRPPQGRRDCVVFTAGLDPDSGTNLHQPNDAYYADDEASAISMAQRLATDHPGVSFLISKTQLVLTGEKPATVPITTAKFTKEGFLPE